MNPNPRQHASSPQQHQSRLPPTTKGSPRRISSTTSGGASGNNSPYSSSAVVHRELALDVSTSSASANLSNSKWTHTFGTRSTGTSPSASARRTLEFAQSARRQRQSMLSNQISTLSAASSTTCGTEVATTGAMSTSLALQSALTPKIDNRPALIIEIGTRLTRIGFAGDFVPIEIFRTEWIDPLDGPGPPRPKPIFDRNRSEQEQYEVLVKFLKNIVFRKLLTTVCSRRVVLVESLLTPTWQRQALAHALFDCASLSPHSVLFAPSHLLCSFPFNARTCLVVDIGADEAVLFPIAEGILMLSNWETSSTACASALEQNVKRLMLQYGRVFRQVDLNKRREDDCEGTQENKEEQSDPIDLGRVLSERDIEQLDAMRLWEDIVVRFCFVSTAQRGRRLQAHLADPQANPFDQHVPHIHLQFGAEVLQVPGIVREGAAELLFTHSNEPDSRSVPQMLLDCIAKVPLDLRREFLQNLLIVGGASRLPGFLARLKTELLNLIADGSNKLAPTLSDIRFYQFPKEVSNQLFCAWLGGSMFGALDDTMEGRSLTRLQWQKTHQVPDWTNAIDSYFVDLALQHKISKPTAGHNSSLMETTISLSGDRAKREERAI